ncbi:MAG: hypothetical protein SF187_16155 [Deltaproteobacteria bacterium]|nr:hypothetical protein [Deltaproteobacteria bacterium]
MRWFGVGLLALALCAGCKSRRRYDGTCQTDADCLDFQKCAAQVCVRKNPIFQPYKPPPVPQASAPPRKSSKSRTAPFEPQPEPPPPPVKPAPPSKPDLGPAVPSHRRDPAQAGKFRLDA